MSQEKLQTEILALSKSQVWHEACREWSLQGIYINEDTETCLCGHSPIVEVCIIGNHVTGQSTTVGNSCVSNFMGMHSYGLFASLRRIMDNPHGALGESAIYTLTGWKVITAAVAVTVLPVIHNLMVIFEV